MICDRTCSWACGGERGRCGARSYTVAGLRACRWRVIFCHCRDCRKSSGAPVSPFAGYGSEQVETEQGTPKVYESSPWRPPVLLWRLRDAALVRGREAARRGLRYGRRLRRAGAIRAGGAPSDPPEARVTQFCGRYAAVPEEQQISLTPPVVVSKCSSEARWVPEDLCDNIASF